MIDCNGQPNLLAFPPIPLTQDDEVSSNATDIYNIQEYNAGDAPFARGDLVKKDGYIYVSKEDNNSEVLATDGQASLAIDGFLYLPPNGSPLVIEYASNSGFTGFTPTTGNNLITNVASGLKQFTPGILGSYLDVTNPDLIHYGHADRAHPTVHCKVKVNPNNNFNTSDTNIPVSQTTDGTNKYLEFDLTAGQFVAIAIYTSSTNTSYQGYYVHASYMEWEFATDNPLRVLYTLIQRFYNGSTGTPIVPLNPEEVPNDPNYVYDGWACGSTANNPTQYFTKGMSVVDTATSKYYRTTKIMPADANRTGFELTPSVVNFSVKLKSNLTKWALVGSTNETSVYQPSPRIQTLGTGNLTFEWSISHEFTALTLASVLGEEMIVTITSADDNTILFTDTYDLTQYNPNNYSEWLFGSASPTLVDIIRYRDLAWSEAGVILRIEITSANNGNVGIGAVYPSNGVTLGLMNYAPIVSGITTTRKVNHLDLVDVEVVKLGSAMDKLNYKTETPSEWLDHIVDNLRLIATIATEKGLPTFFEGQYPYESLKLLGYMPTYDQTLSNKRQTTSSLNITGAL